MLGAAEDEPGPAGARRALLADAPAPRHPQVTAKHKSALEAEQQVLAHRLDRFERPPVQPLDDPLRRGARMGRLHLHALPGQHLQPLGSAVERIALWHNAPIIPPRCIPS